MNDLPRSNRLAASEKNPAEEVAKAEVGRDDAGIFLLGSPS